jgi:hypothetical protein
MTNYVVTFEAEDGSVLYSSAEDSFTYASKPIIFDNKELAEQHAKRYATGKVLEQNSIRPFDKTEKLRAKVRNLLNKQEW